MAADDHTRTGPDVAVVAFDHALRGVHLQVALRWVLVAFTVLTAVAVPPARHAVACGVVVAGYALWALAVAVWTRRASTSPCSRR
jgi:two-component system, NarL family, sensor kinase